jgi:NADPH:quinone reductase-like Zn-dependent oxidoreductase
MTAQVEAQPTMQAQTTLKAQATMKAVVFHRYGPPEQLELEDIERPAVTDDGVLVRVRAASVNALDWRIMRGQPYVGRLMGMGLRKPARSIPGVDLAGIVEAVGSGVTEFKPGDEVIGHRINACAEYVLGKERHFVIKPARLTFEQAAAVPVAGMTALEALRDGGHVQSGQKVLINGAAGGVGTYAVQLAKAFGADVTGVCSTRNVEMVRSIGADHVVDYTKEDFTRSGQRYDLILYINGNRSIADCRRALARDGTLVIVGGSGGRLLGPMSLWLQALVLRRFVRHKLVPFLSKGSHDGLVVLKDLIEAGKVTPVVDRTYPLSETAAALRYLEGHHARAKVVITM